MAKKQKYKLTFTLVVTTGSGSYKPAMDGLATALNAQLSNNADDIIKTNRKVSYGSWDGVSATINKPKISKQTRKKHPRKPGPMCL